MAEAATKICKGPCGKELPVTLEFFHKHPSTKDRHRNECKKCTALRVERWRKRNPKMVKENVSKHAAKRKAAAKKWREDNPDKVKAQRERAKIRRQEQRNG